MKEKNRIIVAILVFTVGSFAMRDLNGPDAKRMYPIDIGFVVAALIIPRTLLLVAALIAAFIFFRAFFAARATEHAARFNEEFRDVFS